MSRTYKDEPWKVKIERGTADRLLYHSGKHTGVLTETNFRRNRKFLKRQGNKRVRRSMEPILFRDHNTLRTAVFYQ